MSGSKGVNAGSERVSIAGLAVPRRCNGCEATASFQTNLSFRSISLAS
jgi:hypothetical protein